MIDYANEFVALTVADLRQVVHGQLVDQSAELIVLYDGIRFMYVPLVHIERKSPSLRSVLPNTYPIARCC